MWCMVVECSDILLVTGMPGCADIMSINRILKIFTKLILLADTNSHTPHLHLLKSLNKLSHIKQTVCSTQPSVSITAPCYATHLLVLRHLYTVL